MGRGRIHRMSSPPRMLRMPPMVLRMLLTAGRMPLMVPQTLHTERRIRPADHRGRLYGAQECPLWSAEHSLWTEYALWFPEHLRRPEYLLWSTGSSRQPAECSVRSERTSLWGAEQMPAACREALRTELMAVSTARATDRGQGGYQGQVPPGGVPPYGSPYGAYPNGPQKRNNGRTLAAVIIAAIAILLCIVLVLVYVIVRGAVKKAAADSPIIKESSEAQKIRSRRACPRITAVITTTTAVTADLNPNRKRRTMSPTPRR